MSVTLKDALARFDHARHKELWDWMSKNLEKSREEWPGFELLRQVGDYCEESVLHDTNCFACDAVGEKRSSVICAELCPLDWPNGLTCMDDGPSLFRLFIENKRRLTNRRRAHQEEIDFVVLLAECIRDLPLRTVEGETDEKS